MLMPSRGTSESRRKCDCRSPPQSSAAMVSRTACMSRPASSSTCSSASAGGGGRSEGLTGVIKPLYLLPERKDTFLLGRTIRMTGREALGAADVTDDRLAAMVAAQLGATRVELLSSAAE